MDNKVMNSFLQQLFTDKGFATDLTNAIGKSNESNLGPIENIINANGYPKEFASTLLSLQPEKLVESNIFNIVNEESTYGW